MTKGGKLDPAKVVGQEIADSLARGKVAQPEESLDSGPVAVIDKPHWPRRSVKLTVPWEIYAPGDVILISKAQATLLVEKGKAVYWEG